MAHRCAPLLRRRLSKKPEWEDGFSERVIIALAALFIERSNDLLGFQQLVPRVFDVYLAKGTPLRSELCRVLAAGARVGSAPSAAPSS